MDVRFWIGATTRCTVAKWNNDAAHEAWSKLYLLDDGAARYAVARPGEAPAWCDLRPGSLYLIPGGRRQINACRSAFTLSWCHFTVQDDDLADRLAALDRIVAVPAAEAGATAELLARAADDGDARLRCTALVFRLLAGLPRPQADPLAAERRQLAPAVARLEYHFDRALSVPQLAAIAGLKPSRFHELFRRVYGTSIHAYQLDLRCAEAQRLLRAGGLSVQEIASRCGYPNPFAFTRMFTRRTGQSPSASRGG